MAQAFRKLLAQLYLVMGRSCAWVLIAAFSAVADAAFTPANNAELRSAVQEWDKYGNRDTAWNKYGAMDNWDVHKVTDMHSIFYATSVNEPIGSWVTSQVTDILLDMRNTRPGPLPPHTHYGRILAFCC